MDKTTDKYKASSFEFKLVRVRETGPKVEATTPEDYVDYWRSAVESADWYTESKECSVVVMTDTKLRIIGHALVSIGTINETMMSPRDVFAPVLGNGAYGFVAMHHHPSGDPSPSQADRSMTNRLREASENMLVTMFDHIIVGKAGSAQPYFSFKESGLM